MTEAETYRYDAFISYRHVEPDRKWATWLHRALESYRTPKPIVAKGAPARLERVFRDEEELAASAHLSDAIDEALEQSRFLIVVCSPRTPESDWVNQEVVRFRELGRHDRILALLIEGAPAESFPQALCEIRTAITDQKGRVTEEIEDVEPLAADVRASRDEPIGFLKRVALMRVLASVLGCRFDDLRRRELERRRRRLASAGVALLVIAAVLAASLIFAIQERNAKAEALVEAEIERDAKARALEEVERLADSKVVRDLVNEVDELWPLHPSKAPDMAGWLRRAEAVLKNRSIHEETLAALREHVLPYADVDRERDHAGNRARLASLREAIAEGVRERALLESKEDQVSVRDRRVWTERIQSWNTQVAGVEELLEDRITWRFESPKDRWMHHVLVALLADMERLDPATGADGLRHAVAKRHGFVTSLRRDSVETHAAAWQATIRGIAASPKYAGLMIAPQLGLVPLGPDPDSGLFEFAHLGSGSLPSRDAKTKRLVLEDDFAILLVLIPGATFEMGGQRLAAEKPNYDPEAEDDEWPVHTVTLSPYFIAKHECTQAQWARMTGGLDPSRYKAGMTLSDGRILTPRHPVELVSWEDCRRVLSWNRLELPTEARWEHSCRSGSDTPWFCGRKLEALGRVANVADAYLKTHGGASFTVTPEVNDGYSLHSPVGSLDANAVGLHDVHGNVLEWCEDAYARYHFGAVTDPVKEGSGNRVTRGGCWNTVAYDSRFANRGRVAPDFKNALLGVRPAMSVISD